ncbi:hypothetical protein [Variovorax atrisoli]|uniref:hypothetical protein n=1 Tax=Variovorax atrisoli TaxID=3394203 RepID=UPI00037C9BFA|nr:hypothetical protein [Variovorax paradoxus]
MSIVLDWLKGAWLWLGAIALLAVGICVQQLRIADGKVDLAKERQARAQETNDRNRAALRESERVAGLQLAHAANQQEIVDVYSRIIQTLEIGRADDAVRAGRLSRQLAEFASRDREAARTDPVACQRVADRSASLAGLAGEGAELLLEGRRLVRQRDAEVELLKGIVANDRRLSAPAPGAE